MVKYSYRFDGSTFTGQKYRYTGPSSDPCRKVSKPSNVEMISNTGWNLSGNNSYKFMLDRSIFNTTYYALQYISISTLGNAANFGELLGQGTYPAPGLSNCHGGLAS